MQFVKSRPIFSNLSSEVFYVGKQSLTYLIREQFNPAPCENLSLGSVLLSGDETQTLLY